MLDFNNTTADTLGGVATAIEQKLGITLDRGRFAGRKAARSGDRITLQLADGDTRVVSNEFYDTILDTLMHDHQMFLELVQPFPGTREAIGAAKKACGSTMIVTKTCAPIGRTTGMCTDLLMEFVIKHDLYVDDVYHDEDREGVQKHSFFTERSVNVVVDNEMSVLRRVLAAGHSARLVHRTPAPGETGWRVLKPGSVPGVESSIGWSVPLAPLPSEALAA